jgi:hypothetical protein
MRTMRHSWTLRTVRRTWAQGKMGKGMAVLLGVAMVMPSLAAVPPWRVAARAGVGGK